MSEPVPGRGGRFGLGHWLRLLVSLALIGWIIHKVDWGEFVRTVRNTDPFYLALSLGISPLLVLVSAWKWKILLKARSQDPGLGTCFKLYLVGYFFNNFLPTNVGGDVVRGYLLGRRNGQPADAMASVFLERFTGISALVALAVVAVPLGPRELYDARVRWSVLTVFAAYSLLLWAVLDRRVLGFTRRRRLQLPLMGKIVRMQEAIDAYRNHRGALVGCLALSVVFYLGAALNILVTARAFQASLSFLEAFAVTPVILLISLLPLSLGGLGLSEWAYVFGLGKYQIAPAGALSTALLMRVKNVGLGLIGGLGHGLSRELVPAKGTSREGSDS